MSALLLPSAGRGKSNIRGTGGKRRQSAQCGQHGYPVCAELYLDALRLYPSRAMGLLRRPRRMSRVSPSQTCDPRRWRLRAPVVRCGICGRIFTRCNGGAINRIFGLMQRIVRAAGTDSDGVILFALLPNDALLLQHGQAHRPLVVARPPVVPGFCAAPRRKSPAS